MAIPPYDLSLTPDEMKLVSDRSLFLAKQRLILKVRALLTRLSLETCLVTPAFGR